MNKRNKPTKKTRIGEETIAFWIYKADGQEIIDFDRPVKVKPKLSVVEAQKLSHFHCRALGKLKIRSPSTSGNEWSGYT